MAAVPSRRKVCLSGSFEKGNVCCGKRLLGPTSEPTSLKARKYAWRWLTLVSQNGCFPTSMAVGICCLLRVLLRQFLGSWPSQLLQVLVRQGQRPHSSLPPLKIETLRGVLPKKASSQM